MQKTISVINGHPDEDPGHFCHALCETYIKAAVDAGHTVHQLAVTDCELPYLRNQQEFSEKADAGIKWAQDAISESDHIVVVYPLWLGTMPARLKSYLEHLARGGFFLDVSTDANQWPLKKMKGKSARLIVTMGMPGLAYKLLFGAHSVRALESGVLRISGFNPVKHTIFGMVDSEPRRKRMIDIAARLGQSGS